jgi:hypothetical protein
LDKSSKNKLPMNEDPRRKWILFGIPFCFFLGAIELMRAFDGNNRSWVYVFEWPFFGFFIYYMYWKISQPLPEFDLEEEAAKNPRRELEE